jgi:hypothetical protein
VTPETKAHAAASDGFVTYDELRGPDLDAARWSPARLPFPSGGEHIPLDPNAELAVGEGDGADSVSAEWVREPPRGGWCLPVPLDLVTPTGER